jgi:alpha-amylase/alpha-mannosidase (GH57 family)
VYRTDDAAGPAAESRERWYVRQPIDEATLRGPTVTDRFVCVHGHFYQPPREDPLTGTVPLEPEAAPYHDFNEKITAECYRPNAELGNFRRISFNLGPTLAAWLRTRHPDVLQAIVECDRLAVNDHGHGAAIAQSYHHTILPLSTERDRRTELRWGIRAFELTFGRKPLGVWLPETAVDTPTLEACADEGLRFTILAPGQVTVPGEPHGAYVLPLPSSRSFDVILYDGALGGSLSFDPIATTWADHFAHDQILPIFRRIIVRPSLVAVATDGEVYGHHHKFKDLFLRELIDTSLAQYGLTPITAEQYVARFPAERRATLHERSSWGCAHELARWSAGCGCTHGPSNWKSGLRHAFDNLAVVVDDVYELTAPRVLRDPWAARDAYVDVVEGAQTFADWYADWHGPHPDARHARVLLEAQRHRLAMYTSCAFYWEDLDRLEPGYGVKHGFAAARLLDDKVESALLSSFRHDLETVVGGRSARTAVDLHWVAG